LEDGTYILEENSGNGNELKVISETFFKNSCLNFVEKKIP